MAYSNKATVLIIDKSGSMSEPASNDIECIGFTRMDFACQGALLCVNACPEDMYMAIIGFDSYANILCSLSQMNQTNKNNMLTNIKRIRPGGGTHLMSAMFLLNQIIIEAKTKNITEINVITLTDGEDSLLKEHNVESEFNQLKINGEFNFKMDTIGFGPNACTNLLIKVANLCSGSYGLCFDASMVGTIFGRTFVRTYIGENAYGIDETQESEELQILRSSEFYELKTKYHEFRLKLVNILSTENKTDLETVKQEFTTFYSGYQDSSMNPNWYQLIMNLEYDVNEQISLAISKPEYWRKWGQAYWQTLAMALDKQYSANFKDKCLQCFGNEIAKHEYDRICDIYDSMQMIKPSGSTDKRTTVIPQYASTFNNASGGCFHPNSKVTLESGNKITLTELEELMKTTGSIKVLKNYNNEYVIIDKLIRINTFKSTDFCQYNNTILTPTHPIMYNHSWIHPKTICPIITLDVECIYNIILQVNEHGRREPSLLIDNNICIALAHGIENDNVVSDGFWGSELFIDELKKLYPEYDETNIINFRHKFIRNTDTGYVDMMI